MYVHTIIIITKGSFTDNLKSLEKDLQKPVEAGLKINIEKLSLWNNINRIPRIIGKQQQDDAPIFQIDYIKAIYVATKVRDVCKFVGISNHYKDMWSKGAYTLAALTRLCYTNVKFE